MRAARVLVASGAACLLTCHGASAQLLPGHSLQKAEALKLDADWWMAGATVPTTDGIVLSPGVPHRLGALWSKTPLLTTDFEVTLKIKGQRPPQRHAKEMGFAFWYVQENGTNVHEVLFDTHAHNPDQVRANMWSEAFDKAGCDLLGFKSQFNGLGVFFLEEDSGPSVSGVMNSGQQAIKLGAGVPASNAIKFDFLNDQQHEVKIKVQAASFSISINGQPPVAFNGAVPPSGYIGFTSFGGNKLAPEAEEKSIFVELVEMVVVNNDKNARGEEVKVTPAPKPEDPFRKELDNEKVDVMAEASSFKDHRSESDAIKDLTNVIFKLVVETQPIRHQMERAIGTLAKRIDLMETNFGELKNELDKKTGHKLGMEFEAIKAELTTLAGVANKETKERHTHLENLHADITDAHKSAHSPDAIDKHLDKLSQSNDKVLDQLTNEHQTMFGVSLAAIAFIVIAGLSLYNKFRCWEKKHVL